MKKEDLLQYEQHAKEEGIYAPVAPPAWCARSVLGVLLSLLIRLPSITVRADWKHHPQVKDELDWELKGAEKGKECRLKVEQEEMDKNYILFFNGDTNACVGCVAIV